MTTANPHARRAGGLIAAVAAIAFAAPALAQNAAPKPAQPAAQGAEQAPALPPMVKTPWVKVCVTPEQLNKEVCTISQEVSLEATGQPLGSVSITTVKDQPNKGLRIIVPVGMLLQPGMRFNIDQQAVAVPYQICLPQQVCVGEIAVNDETIGKLKKAKTASVQALNGAQRPYNIPLDMKDFAKAFDGPGTDPKVIEAERKKLAEALQKKAEERAKAAAAAGGAAAKPN